MPQIKTLLTITDAGKAGAGTTSAVDIAAVYLKIGSPKDQSIRLQRYVSDLVARGRDGSIAMQIQNGDAVAAAGTLTLALVVATDTCIINGVTFTCVVSGAAGNQFNVGGTDTISATNLRAAINASVTAGVAGLVTATSATTVVTVTASTTGTAGNGYTLTGNAHITASGARLTAGAADTATSNTFSYGI